MVNTVMSNIIETTDFMAIAISYVSDRKQKLHVGIKWQLDECLAKTLLTVTLHPHSKGLIMHVPFSSASQ